MALLNNLQAEHVPLIGKHLIEASAGTGKTYNITRLYLRLLLERELKVEQILVMTFTNDATEELRGRIDTSIREALLNWPELIETDAFFKALAENVEQDKVHILLKQALINIDQAAIFTIHGFCKRVLAQYAFQSALPFELALENDCRDLTLTACQDWYRTLAKKTPEEFLLVAEFWPTPQQFLQHFAQAISKRTELISRSPEQIKQNFSDLAITALANLQENNTLLTEALIEVKKGQDRNVRQQELTDLMTWLDRLKDNIELLADTRFVMPDSFIDGRRYSRSKFKAELVEVFSAVNQLKKQQKSFNAYVMKAQAFGLVRQGIYHIREQISAQKQQQGRLSFDDLIYLLADQLSADSHLAEQLFQQYPVALVDEFQDTDQQQFTILQALYREQADSCLFMIGDPKQAIYGFRGGDVFAYLAARQECLYQWVMDTNWRSSAEMITAYNRLFYGAPLAQEARTVFGYGIDYQQVKASPKAAQFKPFNDDYKALQFVDFVFEQSDKPTKVKQGFRQQMAQWCANEIARLLDNEPNILAQDIAILVRDGAEAHNINSALQAKGLSAVFLSNRNNLYQSEQSQQLKQVLQGILFVEQDRFFTSALANPLLGYDGVKLLELQQDELLWQEKKLAFEALRQDWLTQGFIGMALKLMHEHFAVFSQEKDRVLTNILHLFELLQLASQQHREPRALLYWFEQQMSLQLSEQEAELRLESDENLIRIVTQHGSKGLEYPIVFVPYATRHKDPTKVGNRIINYLEYHDDNGELKVCLDGEPQASQRMAEEAYAESIRLLYVAITRAEQRCYLLTADFEHSDKSPLGQTLAWHKQSCISDDLHALAVELPDAIGYQQISAELLLEDDINVANLVDQSLKIVDYQIPEFNGRIERDWWLSSFSALTRNIRHGGVSDPDRDSDQLLSHDESALWYSQQLRFMLPKGAAAGNLLHDILEYCDFTQPQWSTVITQPLVRFGGLPDGFEQKHLIEWLTEILESQLIAGLSLSDLAQNQTLRESEFYFPMQEADMTQLVQLLISHRRQIRPDNSYVQTLDLPIYRQLKGMMHGFIDLIFEHQGKYYVCDYKSSYLGDNFNDYQPKFLAQHIEDNYYDLQYLIYCLALHRQLKMIIPDYKVEQHFGGVYYLYLRGMSNKPEHSNAGVYYRKIDQAMLQALDQLFLGKPTVDEGTMINEEVIDEQ